MRQDAQGLTHPVLRIIPAAGGEVLAELDRARGVQGAPRWSPDGRSLVGLVQQGDSITYVRVDTSSDAVLIESFQ